MATLGFGIAASSIAAGATTATGAAVFSTLGAAAFTAGFSVIGGILDQALIYPALGLTPKSPDLQGDRIDDLQLSLSSEGSPKNYCLGPLCKVPGTVIWLSKMREVSTQGKIGGGKGAQDVINYEYFFDLALGVATDRPISRVTDLWANGQLVYTQTNQPRFIVNTLSVVKITYTYFGGFSLVNGKWVGNYITIVRMQILSPNGGPDLSTFRAGVLSFISGFGTGANNGTFMTISSYKSTVTGQSWVILDNPNCVNEAAGATVDVSQQVPTWDKTKFLGRTTTFKAPQTGSVSVVITQKKKFWCPKGSLLTTTGAYDHGKIVWTSGPNNGKTNRIRKMKNIGGTTPIEFELLDATTNNIAFGHTFQAHAPNQRDGAAIYNGTQLAVDPTIEHHEGSNAKVWSGESYLVIDYLNIKDFGNTVPVSWSVLVEADVSITVGNAIAAILERAGRDPSSFDTSTLTENLLGYFYSGPRPTREALNPLFIAFDLLSQNRDGVLHIFKRANAEQVTILAADLASREYGEAPPPRPVLAGRLRDVDLPAEVQVEFVDSTSVDQNGDPSYEKGTARSPRNLAAANIEVVRQVLDRVTMTPTDAKKVANRILWTMHSAFRQVDFQLPPSYYHLLENDIAIIPFGDGTKKVLVTKITEGHNGMVLGTGLVHEDQTLVW